jgi:cobalt-zinc-cadmium efflux system outer membrane protein
MSTRIAIFLGLTWVICLNVVPLCTWGDSYAQAKSIPTDTPNASAPSLAENHSGDSARRYITPERALELALQHNPELATFAGTIEARTHEIHQSARLPNPQLELELENFGGSGEFRGTSNAEASVRLQQRVELGGKRQRRVNLARSALKLEETRTRAYTSELRALVHTRAITLALAQERLQLALKQEHLSHKFLSMVRERIDTGKAADIEQIAFKIRLSEAQLKTQEAHTEVKRAQYALAALWGEPSPTFDAVALDLKDLPARIEIEDLYASLERTPATDLARNRTKQTLEAVRLERAHRIPDLNLGVGVKEDRGSGEHALIAGIGVEIPIFDRNQDGVAAARARHRQTEAALHAVMIEQRHQLREIWHALESAREKEHKLRTEILPAAQEHFEAVTYAYQAGKYTYQRVLDAQQNLFEMRRRHIDARGDIQRKYVELQRICADPDASNTGINHEPTPELASVADDGDRQ